MKASRDEVLELIRRWESENRSITYEFASTDHSLEINCPSFLRASLDPNGPSAFWLSDGERGRVRVELRSPDSYDITDLRTEGHPTFKVGVDYVLSLIVPFGDLGTLHLHELENADLEMVI
jgi:hypothetical protein